MKQFILENKEKERIIKLYELKGIVINESIGPLIRSALKLASKNEDDIAMLFKSTEKAAASLIDDIVKTKKISEFETLQMQLMHAFNPSGLAENIPQAQQKVRNILNGYAKYRGMGNWNDVKRSIGLLPNLLLGKRISNRTFLDSYSNYTLIDFTQMSTIKNIETFNTVMANAVKTNRFDILPRGGFEKMGIKATDYNGLGFRGFIKDQLSRGAKVNEVDPTTGRWSITFVN
jgi:hypothetical protein